MANADKVYKNLLKNIITNGDKKPAARAGMPGTISSFAEQIKFDLRDEFPILTTKKVSFKNIKTELLWFLKGDTDISYLVANGCNIWNDDAYRNFVNKISAQTMSGGFFNEGLVAYYQSMADNPFDESGAIITKDVFLDLFKSNTAFKESWGKLDLTYPYQWRNFGGGSANPAFYTDIPGTDQVKEVILSLKNQPFGRRHIISAWNPQDVSYVALPACHCFVQFNVAEVDGVLFLDCALTQRSADSFLGVPYNFTSYALLTHIFAKILGYQPRYLSLVLNDAHIYENHMDATNEQILRDTDKFKTPDLEFSGVFEHIERFWSEDNTDFDLDGFLNQYSNRDILFKTDYESYPAIKAELSVGI